MEERERAEGRDKEKKSDRGGRQRVPNRGNSKRGIEGHEGGN